MTKAKILIHYRCTRCNKFHYKAAPIIRSQCDNCHTFFETEADVDIFSTVSKSILTILAREDDVELVAARDVRSIVGPDDIFKPSSKLDFQIYSAFVAIKDTLERNRNYDVSKLLCTLDDEWSLRCKSCGTCSNCVTCKKCSEKYIPQESSGRRIYQCPSCRSRLYRPTEVSGNKLTQCSNCKSDRIRYTEFGAQNKKCTKCNTIAPKAKKIPVYKLTISHQERFRKNV